MNERFSFAPFAANRTQQQGAPNTAKWSRSTLKSQWFDDHAGYDTTALFAVENRLRAFEASHPHNEEGMNSAEVERFFDLFASSEG